MSGEMPDPNFPADNTGLIDSTPWENLLKEIEDKKTEKQRVMDTASKEAAVVKAIMSVYYFLRHTVGMEKRELSLAEFEAAEMKLKEFAESEVKRLEKEAGRGWLVTKKRKANQLLDNSEYRKLKFYLKLGYFPFPLSHQDSGFYCQWVNKNFSSFYVNDFIKHINEPPDPDNKANAHGAGNLDPLNMKTLVLEVLRKRFPEAPSLTAL